MSNGTLHGTVGRSSVDPVATVTCTRSVLDGLVSGGDPLSAAIRSGACRVDGDGETVSALWDLFDEFPVFFPMIEPGPQAGRQ